MVIAAVLVAAVVAVSSATLVLRQFTTRRDHLPPDVDRDYDAYSVAYLSGGPVRVVDAAISAMHADGRLAIGGPGIVSLNRPEAGDQVERAVVKRLEDGWTRLNDLRHRLSHSGAVQAVGDRLATRGLLVRPGPARGTLVTWATTQGVLCLLALIAALAVILLGGVEGRAAEPLIKIVVPALVVGTLIGFRIGRLSQRRISPPGESVLRRYRKERAGQPSPAWRVALQGPQGASSPTLAMLLAVAVVAPAATHGGAGADSGDGDGGGGDGGCGGCGGCG
ncbi:TIGR04222 domain-containing membrane protein [Streptomyces sp. NPDC020965]|uniref:TIGR04222 domain-containing membrane protein n=1 Tax=Streptomyces sp. NPDC020965 TaxID=3365105 RepID=UPI0037A34304